MRKNKGFNKRTLSKETHAALELTTNALVELARYSFEELELSYVLFGKIQTDSLEDWFGKYRQLTGAQYHISIRQIMKSKTRCACRAPCLQLHPTSTGNVSESKSRHCFPAALLLPARLL